jgi:threonylcarbamoyladenosine tRNA methylthiotransferase MtaB
MALDNIKRIKDAFPRATFTTDVMVGFPGESEADFLDTVSFIEDVGFLDAHVFAYSRRKNTPAADYDGQIPEDIKRKRSDTLIKCVNNVKERVISEIVERVEQLPVIFEEMRGEYWYGHSDTYAEVMAFSEKDIHGERLCVKPIRVENGIIIGEII